MLLENVKYILFDLDGTLTDSAPGITNCVRYSLEKMGISVPSYAFLCTFVGPPLSYSYQTFCSMTPKQAEQATEYYRERYRKIGIFENRVYDGIEALLAELQHRGYILAVASSKPEVFVKQILEYFHLDGYFQFLGGSLLNGGRSEKADVVAYVLRQMQVEKKAEAVLVGDTIYDMQGAVKAGIGAIGVLYGYGNRAEMEACECLALCETPDALKHYFLNC